MSREDSTEDARQFLYDHGPQSSSTNKIKIELHSASASSILPPSVECVPSSPHLLSLDSQGSNSHNLSHNNIRNHTINHSLNRSHSHRQLAPLKSQSSIQLLFPFSDDEEATKPGTQENRKMKRDERLVSRSLDFGREVSGGSFRLLQTGVLTGIPLLDASQPVKLDDDGCTQLFPADLESKQKSHPERKNRGIIHLSGTKAEKMSSENLGLNNSFTAISPTKLTGIV
jgi:hypothetical protein